VRGAGDLKSTTPQGAWEFESPALRLNLGTCRTGSLNDLAGAFAGKKATRRLLQAYEAAWARLQRDTPGHALTPLDQAFETALLSWLRFHAAMLIGELVPLTLAFTRANPGLPVLPALEQVLADEFQDLNRADQRLVLALAAPALLLVIGDDNQSIYRFRHANPEGGALVPSRCAWHTDVFDNRIQEMPAEHRRS